MIFFTYIHKEYELIFGVSTSLWSIFIIVIHITNTKELDFLYFFKEKTRMWL
jgi:hypothetical protein